MMDNQDTQGGITQNAVPATSPGGEDEHDGLSQDEPFSQTEPFSQAESFSQAEPFSQADQELHASQAPAPPPAAEPEFCLYRNGSSALLPNGGKAITAGSHRSPSNIKGIPPPAADFNVGSDMRTVSGTHCQVQVEDASSATFKVVHLSKAHDFTTVVRHGSEVIGDLRQAGQSVSACLGDEIQLVLGVTMHIVRVGEGPAGRPGAMQNIVWSSPVPKVAATAQAAPAPEVGLGAAPEASPAASSAAGRGGKGKAMRAPGAKAKQDKARRARKKAAADALGAGAGEGTGDRAAAGAVHGAGAADSAGAGTGTGTGADAGATTGVGGAGAAAATGGGGGDGAGWASVAALPPRARVAVGRFRRAAAEAAADMESAVASGDGTAVLRAQRRAYGGRGRRVKARGGCGGRGGRGCALLQLFTLMTFTKTHHCCVSRSRRPGWHYSSGVSVPFLPRTDARAEGGNHTPSGQRGGTCCADRVGPPGKGTLCPNLAVDGGAGEVTAALPDPISRGRYQEPAAAPRHASVRARSLLALCSTPRACDILKLRGILTVRLTSGTTFTTSPAPRGSRMPREIATRGTVKR